MSVLLFSAEDNLLYDVREIFHLQHVHLVGNVFCRIVWREWGRVLRYVLSLVQFGVDIVDSDARLCFSCSLHRFVHMVSPHALASELWQESGMDIDDAVGESLDEVLWHFGEEAGKDDVVAAFSSGKDTVWLFVELLACDDGSGYAEIVGAGDSVRVCAAAHYDRDGHMFVALKMSDDVFTIGASSADEDGESYVLHILLYIMCIAVACLVRVGHGHTVACLTQRSFDGCFMLMIELQMSYSWRIYDIPTSDYLRSASFLRIVFLEKALLYPTAALSNLLD